MTDNAGCIFCRIASKEIRSEIVFEDDKTMAINDLNPQAPVHVLIIPKEHIEKISDINQGNAAIMEDLVLAANKVAEKRRLDAGFRLVINNGADAGQAVRHLHIHLLGARKLNWPPG